MTFRFLEWEEIAATACAVQNMHVQASQVPGLACYWSSWHDAARDSDAMRAFLDMGAEDRCLGFFVVAACDPGLKIPISGPLISAQSRPKSRLSQ